jgi:hypothetical protein
MIGPGIQGLDPCPVCGELVGDLDHEIDPDTGAESPLPCQDCKEWGERQRKRLFLRERGLPRED